MYRSRKVVKLYDPQVARRKLRQQEDDCPFCLLTLETIVVSTANVRLVQNKYAYQFWDFMKVTDHLLLVPVRHVESLGQLNQEEKQDVIDIIAEYEQRGYNIYARTVMSTIKSVPHQHTHLIKTDNVRAKLLFYLAKPYLLLRR
jgi:diadenosine tetraphosphate (Ap4A) HIT family hydrolase